MCIHGILARENLVKMLFLPTVYEGACDSREP